VLVVDDEPGITRAICRMLRPTFATIAALSAAAARELAKGRQIAVVVSDFDMPGEDGVSGLQALRRLGHAAPAVMVTAYAQHPRVRQAVEEGLVVAVVEKPFDVARLYEVVTRAVEGR
jgi:DNA-binding NtrC family response regulator